MVTALKYTGNMSGLDQGQCLTLHQTTFKRTDTLTDFLFKSAILKDFLFNSANLSTLMTNHAFVIVGLGYLVLFVYINW